MRKKVINGNNKIINSKFQKKSINSSKVISSGLKFTMKQSKISISASSSNTMETISYKNSHYGNDFRQL